MNVAAQFPPEDPTIVLAHARPFRLGAVDVRPGTREVVGPRGREVIEPRVMQVLVALARAGGETVSRDDLVIACWEGRAVGEDAISRVISRLRKLTEGVGRDGWTLETITKVGYRLAPVEPEAEGVAGTPAMGPPASRRGLLIAGGAGVAAVAAGGGALWYARRPKASPLARELVRKAQDALAQGSADETLQAIAFLREAVADSPDYAAAWGALAIAYQANQRFTELRGQAALKQMSASAARRGLELDPHDNDSNVAMTSILWAGRSWTELEARLEKDSVQRDPRYRFSLSRLRMELGRMREAIPPAEAAAKADPLQPWPRFGLGLAQWGAGRTEEAERTARKGLELFPSHYALWFLLFNILTTTGRASQALAFAEDPAYRPGDVPRPDVEISLVVARAFADGKPVEIDAAMAQQLEAARRGIGYAENTMMWTSVAGRLDEAFAVADALYLGRGFKVPAQRFSLEQGRFSVDGSRSTHSLFMPATAAMRRDARFGPLVRDTGLLAYWRSSGRLPDDPNVARLVKA